MGADQEVNIAESCIVKPSEETPRHGLWLTAFDLTFAKAGHTPTVHLYRSGSGAVDDFFNVARLKAALAKALVAFYPLAGRLGVDAHGRPEIDCTGEGALFVVAHSDITADEFSNFQPSPELRRLFVPRFDDPALMCGVQVNFLKCGAVALGMALHHVAVDGISAFSFFKMWSAFSRDPDGVAAAALEPPFLDRTPLCARSPPVVHPDALARFCPSLTPSDDDAAAGSVVNEIFVFSKEQVAALKRACTGGGDAGKTVSTFCSVSAHVWRCLCTARRLPADATMRLSFPASIRRSVKPPLPDSYFGNGIIMLVAAGKVRDIVASDVLASVASQIQDVINGMDDELVRSAIDYMEIAGSEDAFPAGSIHETELRIVSWRSLPVADFGWGNPVVVHRAQQAKGGVVYLMDGVDGSMRILLSEKASTVNDFKRLLYAIV